MKRSVCCKGGNTSNLFSHLRHHHPAEFTAVQVPRSKKSAGGVASSSKATTSNQRGLSEMAKYPRSGNRWGTVTDAVTYWLAKDMQPFYSVEKDGFKKLVKVLDSRYELPGRKYFSQVAIPPQLYSKIKRFSFSGIDLNLIT